MYTLTLLCLVWTWPHLFCSLVSVSLPADRIENMRRQLAVNSNSSAQDMESIQTIELLGEGTFGKVGWLRPCEEQC